MILTSLYSGADLTLKRDNGKIAMDLATEAGHEKAAQLLGSGDKLHKKICGFRDRAHITIDSLIIEQVISYLSEIKSRSSY